jgi:DNA-binding transcriptional regulator YiaG
MNASKTIDFRYTASGLENVILKDLPIQTDDAGEQVVRIPHINRLHKLLARAVASKATGLQPREIRFLRTEMGMTQAELARVVGKDAQTIGRWERAETEPNQSEEMVIRALALQAADAGDAIPGMNELAAWTIRSADDQPFIVDASDPSHYRLPMAA